MNSTEAEVGGRKKKRNLNLCFLSSNQSLGMTVKIRGEYSKLEVKRNRSKMKLSKGLFIRDRDGLISSSLS